MGSARIYNREQKPEPFAGYRGRITEHRLDSSHALEWARQRLPERLLALVALDDGDWSAPLPEQTPDEAVAHLDSGVLPEPPISEWKPFDPSAFGPEMAQRIASSLGCSIEDLITVPKASLVLMPAQRIADHILASGDALALIRDMCDDHELDYVSWTFPSGVFYPVAGADWDRARVADLMDLAASSSAEFALLTFNVGLDPASPADLADDVLDSLFTKATAIVLGAYDGEGYVYWTRRDGTVQQAHPAERSKLD